MKSERKPFNFKRLKLWLILHNVRNWLDTPSCLSCVKMNECNTFLPGWKVDEDEHLDLENGIVNGVKSKGHFFSTGDNPMKEIALGFKFKNRWSICDEFKKSDEFKEKWV